MGGRHAVRSRERHRRRRQLRARHLRPRFVIRSPEPQVDVERAPRRSQPFVERSPAVRRGTSGRPLLPAALARAGPARRRHRRARCGVPRDFVLRAARSRQGLRVESHVVDLGPDRRLRRGAVRRRHALSVPGLVPRDGDLRRRHAQGPAGEVDRRLLFRTTVHGPVIGYATVDGRRVAISRKRSTRGRELLSGLAWQDLNTNKPKNAREFLRSASRLEMSFNWVYADDRDIATFSSGRLPIRPGTVDPGLPTSGNGDFEWRGFLPFARHPQAVSPASGVLANWNNKPAPGFSAADDQWSYGSVQRVELLQKGLAARRTHTLASVVSVMNAAATQDLRVVEVWPSIRAVLDSGPAPSARARSA